MFVDKNGRRFCNESNSYVEVTKAMYAAGAVPTWLIFDDEYQRRYPWGRGMPKLRNFLRRSHARCREWVTALGQKGRDLTPWQVDRCRFAGTPANGQNGPTSTRRKEDPTTVEENPSTTSRVVTPRQARIRRSAR